MARRKPPPALPWEDNTRKFLHNLPGRIEVEGNRESLRPRAYEGGEVACPRTQVRVAPVAPLAWHPNLGSATGRAKGSLLFHLARTAIACPVHSSSTRADLAWQTGQCTTRALIEVWRGIPGKPGLGPQCAILTGIWVSLEPLQDYEVQT